MKYSPVQTDPARNRTAPQKVGTDEYRVAYLLAAHWTKQSTGKAKSKWVTRKAHPSLRNSQGK